MSITHDRSALELRPEGHPDRSESLCNLTLSLHTRYERWAYIEDLEEAILLHRDALELRPDGHSKRYVPLGSLANSLRCRYQQNGKAEDLEEAIELQRAGLESLPDGHPDQDLEEAIELHRDSLKFRPEGHPDRAISLSNLATSVHIRFSLYGRTEDFEEAIRLHSAALELRPDRHPDRSISLGNLATALCNRYEQCGRTEDLEEAIRLNQAALELHPGSHPLRAKSLGSLSSCLSARYKQHGKTEDLERAIELERTALELRPEGHPLLPSHLATSQILYAPDIGSTEDLKTLKRPSSWSKLHWSFALKYRQHGGSEGLGEAIKLHRSALELRPENHPSRSISLGNLANPLHTRYTVHGRTADLEEAIELGRSALVLRPKGHPLRSTALSNLASSLRTQWEVRGRTEDLEEVVELERASLALLQEGHPDRSVTLCNLAFSLRTQFEQNGRIAYLEEAIKLDRKALELCSEGHYQSRPEDLEEVIELNRASLELRSGGHPDHSVSLCNLASSLYTRYEQNGRTKGLEEAIELDRTALELLPQGHPDRSISLGNLANSLHSRYKQYGMDEDLEESIELNRAALELRPEGRPKRPSSLSNLANALCTRYKQRGRAEDIEEAIELERAALELRPEGYSHHSACLANLAGSLHIRYQRYGRTADIEEALQLGRAALKLRPEGHPSRSVSLCNLANSLYAQIKQQLHANEFEECMQLLELATTHKFSRLMERLIAARTWVLLARLHNHPTSSVAYKEIISILQHALTINPTLHEQHDFLLRSGDYRMLTMDEASLSVEKNELKTAIELLEQGRGLLWSQLRGFRTPLDQLSGTNKELADRFKDASTRLENLATSHEALMSGSIVNRGRSVAIDGRTEGKSFDQLLKLKRQLSNEQEVIIHEIRRVAGFENFLRATPFMALQRAALEGPVIVVNHSTDDLSIDCVPLDDEFYDDSVRLCNELVETRERFHADSLEYDEKLCETMAMLWDRVVSKVVIQLKERKVVEGSRIWWCPTLTLSVLPFHAAGPFLDADGNTKHLLDDYVSSYTPTLGALINARLDGAEKEPTILVIGDLTDDSGLVSAKREIHNIGNSGMKNKKLLITNEQKVSPDRVIRALQKTTWIHFPEFAFLSACHTAEQPHNGAHDEVLHLAAAMQFSGFRSVIGTMWALLDEDGPAFAKTVYAYINDCEEGEAKYKRAAGGLRQAASELKARNAISTEQWVNFVHIGA
ncbi:TPR-like protein [Fomitiporia mediterranea MF3/22]|uniref:TPR-like protein n=1 Tax=Fomitiporia mediterranea (strain MF3/22) TaxID=694068 RepID=UPI0004409A90|nr:TPR-like protein [Fomitiporia mediterranea MF3/22]EJD02990.1 TPR-like protein [Fomitiporia mediterranea MF3/22]